MTGRSFSIAIALGALFTPVLASAFCPHPRALVQQQAISPTKNDGISPWTTTILYNNNNDDVLNAAIAALYGDPGQQLQPESPAQTRARIQALVDTNKILLFMKGSKSFPQCGFSDTATKILEQLTTGCTDDFETVDVLADQTIRQGIKEYSQWPTIPQLYIAGEFIGGSDIMLEMYQSGELKELIEKATSTAS
jgi:monothiol glutaredoxin